MTTVAGVISDAERDTTVAVAALFPDVAVVHRFAWVCHKALGTTAGRWTEIRPLCWPDSEPAERFYELSVPMALYRGGIPCGHAECFGGAA